MEYTNKEMALAEFLKVDPALISNDYSHYYSVNKRTVKRGRSPEQIKQDVADLKSLLTPQLKAMVTKSLRGKLDAKMVNDAVNERLETYKDKVEKRLQQLQRSSYKLPETDVDAYIRLKNEYLYIGNLVYIILGRYYRSVEHEQLVNAWLGAPVSDVRRDVEEADGEYLVMRDEEADEWEKEGLENLFSDMTHEVPDGLKQYMDTDRFVEEHSGNRGENISGYDSMEHEVEYGGETFYIYRHN